MSDIQRYTPSEIYDDFITNFRNVSFIEEKDHLKAMEAKDDEIALLKQLVKDWEKSATTETIKAQAKEIERLNSLLAYEKQSVENLNHRIKNLIGLKELTK